LRTEVLTGCARPEGLVAIVYHGMLRGLAIVQVPTAEGTRQASAPAAGADAMQIDRDLVRLIANILLKEQSKENHVY
jgi:hypothetical protein